MVYFLVLATFIGSAILGVGFSLSSSFKQQAQLTRTALQTMDSQNTLEAVRAELLAIMRQQGRNGVDLRSDLRTALSNPRSAPAFARYLTTEHRPIGADPSISTRIAGVSAADPGREVHHADLRVRWNGPVQKREVNARIRLGQNTVFSNAITGQTFECTFCHVHVYGNVAEYAPHTGDYRFDKRIHGQWFSRDADLVGATAADGSTRQIVSGPIVGANQYKLPIAPQMAGPGVPVSSVVPDFWGATHLSMPHTQAMGNTYMRDFQSNAQGAALPFNFQRQEHILPKLDPEAMMRLANGSLTGGRMLWYPYGRTPPQNPPGFSALLPLPQGVQGVLEGNVLINGRDAGPLTINGRIFVRGDVIIFGRIQGQGEIYAGRNIYVADDLTYVNPPVEFNGSENSNRQMASVYLPARAQAMANTMNAARRDRLALFATNNIVIGDPYPESMGLEPGTAASENLSQSNALYLSRAVLDLHYLGQVAFDKQNGYQLDAVSDGAGGFQFIFPWGNAGNFLRASNVHEAPVRKYRSPVDAPSDKAWQVDSHHLTHSEAFQTMFWPKNLVNGAWIDWITSRKFIQEVQNVPEWNYQMGDPPYGPGRGYVNPQAHRRRRAVRYVSLPLFKQAAMDPSKWRAGSLPPYPTAPNGVPGCTTCENSSQTEGAMETIDRHTGALTEAARTPNPIPEGSINLTSFQTEYPPSEYQAWNFGIDYATQTMPGFPFPTLRKGPTFNDALRYFLELCVRAVQGNGTPSFPGLNATGLTRNGTYSNGTPYAPVPFLMNGLNTNLAGQSLGSMGSVQCSFAYSRVPGPNPQTPYLPGATAEINYVNQSVPMPGGTMPPLGVSAACSDLGSPWVAGAPLNATAYQPAPPCFRYRFDPTGATPRVDMRSTWQGDFLMRIYYFLPAVSSGEMRAVVDTRYWDPERMRPRNIVRNVQAFLFANQLVAYPSDNLSDTQIKIDGGIVAKDFAGRLASATGYMTPYNANNPLNTNPIWTSSYIHGEQLVTCATPDRLNSCMPRYPALPLAGQLPALILLLDPRAQFTTELLYNDFGTPEFLR